jgi:thioredoxin-dependent peroxiredoxin
MLIAPVMMVLASASPEVGSAAPDFSAQDTEGKTQSLSRLVKDQTVVVAFFPKAFTAG